MENLDQVYASGLTLDKAVFITLGLIIISYIVYSVILYYHWKVYSNDIRVTGMTLATYFSMTVPLLIIMIILAFII